MSTRWASGSVAGVALVDAGGRDLRTDVLESEALQSSLVGDSVFALDLSVHTQLLARGGVGIKFGIRIAQIPATILFDIVGAMDAALLAGNPFPVVLADDAGIDDINVNCVLDYAAMGGRPYQRGGMAASYVKDLVIRFISVE